MGCPGDGRLSREAIAQLLWSNPGWLQFATFAAIGVTATVTHATVALLSHHFLAASPFQANLAGYVSAVGVSFFGNRHVTFRGVPRQTGQFLRFVVISLAGFALTQAITYVGASVLGFPFAVALAPAVTLVPVATFVMSKTWAFAAADHPSEQGSRHADDC